MAAKTPNPNFCKCATPVTFDFHTNVIVPITVELNIPRGNSGFPAQNLFLKSYIHGCHDISGAYCYAQDNTLRASLCPSYKSGIWPLPNKHPPYFSIKEPANCNIRPTVVEFIRTETPNVGSYSQCSTLRPLEISDYLSYIEGIYGYLPSFLSLYRWGFDPLKAKENNFSLSGSNGLFTCCKDGILQDLFLHKLYEVGEISNVVVNAAEFSPNVHLRFPIFLDHVVEAWKRGDLDNLTLYGPIILSVDVVWTFDASVIPVDGRIVNLKYYLSTRTIFVKILQFPFQGGNVSLDRYSYGAGCIEDNYNSLIMSRERPARGYTPIKLDTKERLPVLFPDILNAIENMRATIYFGELTPNPVHSENGVIDWDYVYKGWEFSINHSQQPNPWVNC